MKNMCAAFVLFFMLAVTVSGQQVNGLIYADTAGLMVVKVWGTHQQRGYALGYLTGDRITDMIVNYIKPSFGPFYTIARNTVIQGNDLTIPPDYNTEAQAVIDGMNAAGTNTGNLDKTDVLVGNTFLDISNLLMLNLGMNCSALMSWNDATAGTDLNGTSVITRHLDWTVSTVLNRNHIVIVHFPSEPNESRWLLVGFSGMMSILSGFNPDFGAFQNMMDDYTPAGLHNQHYTPIWFALRKAIEANDYNSDGHRDVQDVRSALLDCTSGFADGFLVSALAKSDPVDSLVAMVAELATTAPRHTFRSSAYPDSIPGDNLYTANYQIARNNMMHFCTRYNGIRSHIGNGTLIGRDTSWNLMKNWSHLPHNMQFMQFAPEADLFRISIYRNSQPAYLNEPLAFTLSELFNSPVTGTSPVIRSQPVVCRFDPSTNTIEVNSTDPLRKIEVFDLTGRIMIAEISDGESHISLPLSLSQSGMCLVKVMTRSGERVFKIVTGRL